MDNSPKLFLIFYFCVIYAIAFVAYRKIKGTDGYILGNRSFGPYVTALSAGASDLSGWLLLAAPGMAYTLGLSWIWVPIGMTIGAYLNWLLIAKPLCEVSHKEKVLTIAQYMSIRFNDSRGTITFIIAILSLIFFSVYVASGFVACGELLHGIYHINYHLALLIAVVVTTCYVLIGGFFAVNWVDVFQSILVVTAVLLLPAVMFYKLIGTPHLAVSLQQLHEHFFNPFWHLTWISLASFLGWGLGYFGQIHILVRFMAAKNPKEIPLARRIGVSWVCLCMFGAMCIGIAGALTFHHISDPNKVFLMATESFYNPFFSGILIAAVLSAIMSTIAAQLLISSSALIEDMALRLIGKDKPISCKLRLDKLGVVVIAVVSGIIAHNPKSGILNLVAYAWGGLGSTLGPAFLFSLNWPKTTKKGVICGMIVGALVAIIWPELSHYGGIFNLFSVIPGFLLSALTIYVVSRYFKSGES